MKTITLLLFILLSTVKSMAQVSAFRHIADKGVPPVSHIEELNVPGLNSNSDKVLIVRKVKTITEGDIQRFPNKVSSSYNFTAERHNLLYEDTNIQMEAGTLFNVLFVDRDTAGSLNGNFTHTASSDTFNENINYASVIDNAITNDDPTWRFLVSSFFGIGEVTNEEIVSAYFDLFGTGEWVLQTLVGINFPVNSEHNIVGETSTIFRYKHTSTIENRGKVLNSATQFSFFTVLDDPFINNNPDALVFAETVVPTGSSNAEFPFEYSVYYNEVTGFWELHIEFESFPGSDFNFPINKCFNIFALEETLSINDFTYNETINVFPNPTTNSFNIKTQKPISEVILFNILGQKLKTIEGNGAQNLQIDISSYPDGNYFAKVKIEDSVETIQLIKN